MFTYIVLCFLVTFCNNLLATGFLLIAVTVLACELLTWCFNMHGYYVISTCYVNKEKHFAVKQIVTFLIKQFNSADI